MAISADFECGNIVVESETDADVALSIRNDSNASYFQWFYFKDTPQIGLERTYRIYNAYAASYPLAWKNYNVLASYNGEDWFRIPSYYDGSHFMWMHRAEEDAISFAFFVPYLEDQRTKLIENVSAVAHVTHRVLSKSLQGRDIDLLVFGDEGRADVAKIWVVSRQHAGEPMAEYATEAIIRKLADTNDANGKALVEKATVYVVPNMNPDGSALGNLRANSAGVDLNRIWHSPDSNTPSVSAVLAEMEKTGVDYFIDMHGDETRPYLWFIAPNATVSPQHQDVQQGYEAFIAEQFPEVQPPPQSIIDGVMPEPGLSINYIAKTYDCPAWVIELPFKETPVGDTLLAQGCMRFGRACVDAFLHVMG